MQDACGRWASWKYRSVLVNPCLSLSNSGESKAQSIGLREICCVVFLICVSNLRLSAQICGEALPGRLPIVESDQLAQLQHLHWAFFPVMRPAYNQIAVRWRMHVRQKIAAF